MNPLSQLSITGTGTYIFIIEMILHLFGINPTPGSVASIISDCMLVASWAMIIIGQLRRKDLHLGLIRK